MKPAHAALLFAAIVAFATAMWLFRWEKLHGTAAGVFLLDRWSGEVHFASPHSRFRVLPRRSATDFLDEN